MSNKGIVYSVKKFLFLFKRKTKKLKLKLAGKPQYTNKQLQIFQQLKIGDVILGKMPMSDRELYDVPDGHRHRPYLVVKKGRNAVTCLQGSHKQYSEDSDTFSINIANFGQYNGDTFFSVTDYYDIPIENINRKLMSLSEKELVRLERGLMVRSDQADIIHLDNVARKFQFGDIVKSGKKEYLITNDRDNVLKGYQLTEKPVRNGFSLMVNNRHLYVDLHQFRTFNSTHLSLVRPLTDTKISELKRFIRTGIYIKPGDVIRIKYEFYYVFKTIRNEIHTYHLSTQRLENSVKIKISNRNYYVNVRNIVKFTDLKRDVVYYTLSDKLLQYINESKKKVRPDNRNRKTK